MKKNKNILYIFFILKIIFKKNSSLFFPLIMIFINFLFFGISFLDINSQTTSLLLFINIFINIFLTILFGILKSLNIFKDFSNEGIDIIIFSKPISRKNIFINKFFSFILIGIIWNFFLFFSQIFFILKIDFNLKIVNLSFFSFLAPLFSYIIFGLITTILSLKFNSKISLFTPIMFFLSFSFLGMASNVVSQNQVNKIANFFNIKYENYDSGTILDVEKFYLNNNIDSFYIIPKNLNNKNFSNRQKKFIIDAFNKSKNESKFWQIFSWLSIPYQLINIFNYKDNDFIKMFLNKQKNELKDYIYYNKLDSKENNYNLTNKNDLIYFINDNNEKKYLVPGSLKNNSLFSNLENKEIIYARKNVDNFNIQFSEDNNPLIIPNNFVGKIKWIYIKEALESQVFLNYAKRLFNSINNKNIRKIDILELIEKSLIEKNLNNYETIVDKNTTLFNTILDTSKIKNLTEKKIYIAILLIYYLYFNEHNSNLLKSLLTNDDLSKKYEPFQYEININGKSEENKYIIGGFESYNLIQKTINNKIIYRFEMKKNNNFLFQTLNNIYQIKISNVIVNKKYYILIWILIGIILTYLSYFLNKNKDYK